MLERLRKFLVDWPTRKVRCCFFVIGMKSALSLVFFFLRRSVTPFLGGQGGKVERLFREARAYTVFAGSEEIMLDLGMKETIKQYIKSVTSAKL